MKYIQKAAGIIIVDRKLLVTRTKGKDIFIAPGGKIESGESPVAALIRELNEELGVTVGEQDLEYFGEFEAPAAEQEEQMLRMTTFIVRKIHGEIRAQAEVEETALVDHTGTGLSIGSIFAHQVMPLLYKQGRIV